MYDAFLGLFAIILFIALPVFIILLIVRAIKKKPVKKIVQSLLLFVAFGIVCIIGGVCTMPEDIQSTEVATTQPVTETEAEMETETESATAEETTEAVEKTTVEPTTEAETTTEIVKTSEPTSKTEIVTEVATTEKVDKMIQQFIDLGFTQSEAKEIKKIFITVGITEISNIQAVGNAGIDKLQAFQCDIFESRRDKGGPSLLFTVEKRTLCHMSLNGFMNTNSLEYDSVVLYEIWNEDGTINYNAVGYKAVVDYEKGKINKY